MKLTLLLLLALAAILGANAVVAPLGQTVASPQQLAEACIGQGSRHVCYPLPNNGRQYVDCGAATPTPGTCRVGTRFDYVKRTCVRASYAKPCPTWYCPVNPTPGGPLGAIYGQFGMPGNLTIPLYKQETFTIYCPVNGHCLGGMQLQVHVTCPAPPDRTPYTFELDWEETVMNNETYPKRLPDLYAFCGDSVLVEWDEPVHLVQLFNTSDAAASLWTGVPINPYPPQPVYEAPIWPQDQEEFPIPNPQDVVVAPVVAGAWNATWTATQPEEFFFVCPLSNHARLGMIFKTTVVAAPANHTPVQTTIEWIITSNNYPDMTLSVGDSIYLYVPPNPPMAHGLYKVPTSEIKAL